MRTTLRHSLAACIALSALMLTGNACTDHDDLRTPAGTQLLALGEVTVAGTQTAATRSAAGTRAATEQDPNTGFIGIRKTLFVENDELALTLTAPNGSGGTTDTPVTATLGAAWTLTDRTYYTPGTTLTATYTPATQPGSEAAGTTGGIRYADVLTATTGTLPTDGSKLSLTLTHANALIEVTPPDDVINMADGTYTIALSATPAATSAVPSPAAEELGIAREEGATTTDLRYRTIAPADATLSTISLKVNGMAYTTTLTQQVEANKRYPITLSITKDKLVATVGASDLNWGQPEGFDGRPGGYTRYIYTADDLAQFAADVINFTPYETEKWSALQMADIDLGNITSWTPIGILNRHFMGSYNGNGHTISNLKIDQGNSGHSEIGLFGYITNAKITGVHLRNCKIISKDKVSVYAGALVGYSKGSIITLCSATGSVEVTGNTAWVGGLIGCTASSGSTSTPANANYISRCSADVAVTSTSDATGRIGGFTGRTINTYYASCIASGDVNMKRDGYSSGFSHTNDLSKEIYHAYNCITTSTIVNDNTAVTSAFGAITYVRSCLATQPSYGNFLSSAVSVTDNVTLGTLITGNNDVSTQPTTDQVYTKLTVRNLHFTNNGNYFPIKTLHYSKEDGYTLDVVERKWYALDAWKDNGTALPTLNMTYEGSPEAITGTNRVYTVNGYYVTAPEAETTPYAWNASTSADAMASDPCATGAANGWRMPTMKDFEAIAGWSIANPWSQSAAIGFYTVKDPVYWEAFPDAYYWSSIASDAEPTKAWGLWSDRTSARYIIETKSTNTYRIRCVQEQKITP